MCGVTWTLTFDLIFRNLEHIIIRYVLPIALNKVLTSGIQETTLAKKLLTSDGEGHKKDEKKHKNNNNKKNHKKIDEDENNNLLCILRMRRTDKKSQGRL